MAETATPLPNQLIPSQLVDFLTPRGTWTSVGPQVQEAETQGESFYDIPVASMTGRCFEGTWDWLFRLPFMKPSWNKPYMCIYIGKYASPMVWCASFCLKCQSTGFDLPQFPGGYGKLAAENRKDW